MHGSEHGDAEPGNQLQDLGLIADIEMVGRLVEEQMVRLLVGSDHRRVLPVGALAGAAFMTAADLLARTIVAPQEMPIGVITAFIGAPALVILIRSRPYSYGTAE